MARFKEDRLRLRLAARQLGWMQLPLTMSFVEMPPFLLPLIIRLSAMSSSMYPAFVLHQHTTRINHSLPANPERVQDVFVAAFAQRSSSCDPRGCVPRLGVMGYLPCEILAKQQESTQSEGKGSPPDEDHVTSDADFSTEQSVQRCAYRPLRAAVAVV